MVCSSPDPATLKLVEEEEEEEERRMGFPRPRLPLCFGGRCISGAYPAFARSLGNGDYSSVAKAQDVNVSGTRWHELPPVPRQVQRESAWELSKTKTDLNRKGPDWEGEMHRIKDGDLQITALWWVTKCCPSLPHSLRQKLFRLRQVRKRPTLDTCSVTHHKEQFSNSSGTQLLELRLRRVSGKAILKEGTVLCLPKSVFQECPSRVNLPPRQHHQKTQHEPTPDEAVWLQSLVLYKDSEILVVNKPPGLPVQGGSDIKRSLDSLMGTALRFEFNEGPRLVHRLDKETSGLMLLARTQECAMWLHSLFRNKTATASQPSESKTSIDRVYWALVIGTPKQPQGRISVPLIKLVLDKGKVDKIMVAHDFSSENSHVAITDYKVVGPSYLGCTWLELHPLTGRKHQLRVHCAEVLGTPVLGDMRYGWQTHKEWFRHEKPLDMETIPTKGVNKETSAIKLEATQETNSVEGSILSKEPLLHLHCRQMALPNVTRELQRDMGRSNSRNEDISYIQFVAPLPRHMLASKDLWACKFPNIFKAKR